MRITVTKEWAYICLNCGHGADVHNLNKCQQVTHREYSGSMLMLDNREIKDARVGCDCGVTDFERVLVKQVKESE